MYSCQRFIYLLTEINFISLKIKSKNIKFYTPLTHHFIDLSLAASRCLGNMCNNMAHPDYIPVFPHRFFQVWLSWTGGAFVNSYLQVIPQILNRKSGLWPGPLKDVHMIVWSLSSSNLACGQCPVLQSHPDACESACLRFCNSISSCICFLLSHV